MPTPNGAPKGTTLRSLRRLFWLTFLPSVVVFVSGLVLILNQVGRVHTDVRRLFEETREVDLVRALLVELKGLENWVQVAVSLPAAAHEVAKLDAHKHLVAAIEIAGRFEEHDEDPSDEEHSQAESRLLHAIETGLPMLASRFDEPDFALADAHTTVDEVVTATRSLAQSIQHENIELGNNLDQSSEDIVQLVLLLGLVGTITVTLAAVMLHRRVLRPLHELRQGAARFGEGDFAHQLPVEKQDELGLLARTMQDMAQRIEEQQLDLEARVEQRTRELLRTARLADLGTLAAGVAHEINNPLAAIATCAEGLQRSAQAGEGADRAQLLEYLEIIGKEAMRARDTTQRLLAFARQDSGQSSPVWLQRDLQEVAKMLEHSAAHRGIAIEVSCEEDLPPVAGQAADLRQVLFNLLKNAIDASPRDSKVVASMRKKNNRLILSIADEGHGVAPDMKEKIFEPFVTTKGPGHGTGLGLPISHRIVTGHGGHLNVEDRPAGGAVFTVDLPAQV
jgi:signal transduction histidine kinase